MKYQKLSKWVVKLLGFPLRFVLAFAKNRFLELWDGKHYYSVIKLSNAPLVKGINTDLIGFQLESLDKPMEEFSQMIEDDISVVDIGARGSSEIGKWGSMLSKLSFYGFEGGESACEELAKNDLQLGLKSKYYPFLIGDYDGEADFYLRKRRTASSVFDQTSYEYMTSRFRVYYRRQDLNLSHEWAVEKKLRLPIRTLDSLFNSGEIPQMDFVKIDVNVGSKSHTCPLLESLQVDL